VTWCRVSNNEFVNSDNVNLIEVISDVNYFHYEFVVRFTFDNGNTVYRGFGSREKAFKFLSDTFREEISMEVEKE